MFLLDTDTASLLFTSGRTPESLQIRVLRAPSADLAISIVTAEEMLRGALDAIRKAQSRKQPTFNHYQWLGELLRFFAKTSVVPLTVEAEAMFDQLPAQVKRVGTNDCRIACSALASGAILVTRNTKHFERIPGLEVQDWTR